MDGPTLLDIAAGWSFWDRPVPRAVPRRVRLPNALDDRLALVVQGVRRCGKSTLLRQLVNHYGLDPQHCAFVNFEDPRLTSHLDWHTLDTLVQAFRARHPAATKLTFFLDEIQAVEGWQRWLRTQLDQPRGHNFVITGSNATLLSGELGSTLTGRHLTIELFPFDLQEFRGLVPGATLETFLHDGGFPGAIGSPDADALRRQYFLDIVERDVRERVSARSSLPVRQVAQMAFEAAGSELSLRRVAGATGLAIETAGAYLSACEGAYLLSSVPWFAWSERQRAHRNRKYYPVDPGLRRVVVTAAGADRGKALECATHTVLRRRFGEVFYWRDDGEVDFVVRDGARLIPIQVSWDGPQPRHESSLQAFYERFPQAAEAVFVTRETFGALEAV